LLNYRHRLSPDRNENPFVEKQKIAMDSGKQLLKNKILLYSFHFFKTL